MTFYKLQNSLKSPPECRKWHFRDSIFPNLLSDPLEVSLAFGARPLQAKTKLYVYVWTATAINKMTFNSISTFQYPTL